MLCPDGDHWTWPRWQAQPEAIDRVTLPVRSRIETWVMSRRPVLPMSGTARSDPSGDQLGVPGQTVAWWETRGPASPESDQTYKSRTASRSRITTKARACPSGDHTSGPRGG